MEIWEFLAKFIKLLEFYKDGYSHNLFKLMKFKFDNTIINILNMKFNEFLEMLKSLIRIWEITPHTILIRILCMSQCNHEDSNTIFG
jgi:biotin synthase-related radical SAM superfamily protein